MQHSKNFQIYSASAGSGKTFTLVKEYLKILLLSDNSFKFQQILAVTFTNKAAGEMKERVIQNLKSFSNFEKNNMLSIICKETNLLEDVIFKKSKVILNAILQNYGAFNITTIDSFTHKIIRTFAHDLKLPMNFDVEMDSESLLNEAVDIVISKIGENKELTTLLVNYAIQKLDDDKAWDISNELKDFAKIILNENHTTHLKSLNNISIEAFKNLKNKLQKENKKIESTFNEIGTQALEIIAQNGINIKDFGYSGEFPNYFIKLQKFRQQKPGAIKFDGRLNKTIEENKNLYAAKCDPFLKQTIDSMAPNLKELYYTSKKLFEATYGTYVLNSILVESLIPLAVLNYVNSALQDIKQENNILLNAEFNQLISDTIKDEPAPFIYERLGEKFRYYFLDEMQDTSQLQWKNLIPLIENALTSENEMGETGQLLLVGDAKQSIYRWRGGNPEQFIALSLDEGQKENNPFYVEKQLSNLDTNYRSYSEIIEFNNGFFKFISQFLANKSYSNLYVEGNSQKTTNNIGGFVQLSFVEKDKNDEEKDLVYPKKVFDIIQNLDATFKKNEVCVLVRTKAQGITIANYLSENNIEIISSETLLLKNNEKVNFIITILNVINNPLNKEYKAKMLYSLYNYLQLEISKHEFLSSFINLENDNFFNELKAYNYFFNYQEYLQLPFYESFEYIIRSFNLTPESDSDMQFFLDFVFEYQQKKQPSINDFLELWELKKDKLSIVAPEAENAVRIMTIHKAKGLEFPVVIYPYDIDIYRQINPKVWYKKSEISEIDSFLVKYSSKLNLIGRQGEYLFQERKEALELDNFNILYVALTRAVEQLYIVSELKNSTKNNSEIKFISSLFVHYLKQQGLWNSEVLEYAFGDPKRIEIPVEEKSNTTIQTVFISNSWKNHNISIVANSSLLWDTEQGKAIGYGNLIHEILSKIITKNDIDDVIKQYVFNGTISKNDEQEILDILNSIVHHPQLKAYFNTNNEVYNEQEIITQDKKIIIPDRLVVNNNKVTIIDYKTGNPDKKYQQQLLKYATTLKKLNYTIAKKIIVYINNEIIIEEV
ncbi:UvrD-helicase domain-containing protein [Lutibacter sp. A80]|uniref:UvrD-helicase domain-containing protein n=1 Tax=Lutibacter sp. A80 TaxID=2918453 RepID=UPI001F06B08F|nr:UvrD-helicase domain-containing protein [Lutibacter sp. A80]UMB59491.1 UvrD-helicase domain-containing protein [Lutibacter sp. A80]